MNTPTFAGFPMPPAPSNEVTQEEIYQTINMLVENQHNPQTIEEIKEGVRHYFKKEISDVSAQAVIAQVNAKLSPAPIQPAQPAQPIQPAPQPTAQQAFSIPPIPGQTVPIPEVPAELVQEVEQPKANDRDVFKTNVIEMLKNGDIPADPANIEQYFKAHGQRCGKKTAEKILAESGVQATSQVIKDTQSGFPAQMSKPQAAQIIEENKSKRTLFVDCQQSHPPKAVDNALHVLMPVIQQIETTLQISDYRQTPDKSGIIGVCNAIKSNPQMLPQQLVVNTHTLPRDVVSTLRTMYDYIVDKMV